MTKYTPKLRQIVSAVQVQNGQLTLDQLETGEGRRIIEALAAKPELRDKVRELCKSLEIEIP